MPSLVRLVTEQTLDDFLDLNRVPKALVFSSHALGGATPPVLKAASLLFRGRLMIGEVKPTDKQLSERYSVTHRPLVLVLDRLGRPHATLQQTLSLANVTNFLEEYAIQRKPASRHDEL
eukprot:c19855_g1_i2.p1 GENE.c19855_g1_i2~~c19855_g1_i2.p1  ORF type:complete len:119 (+),score=21.10 c19855_g1_i2:524-880(+)